ncbi:ribosome assembly factor SBDS [Candidatus Pacearchaeota archaeon]|nr:ribosome assembly factor SBDS [Candidatus Pacearchaeota archaeon]
MAQTIARIKQGGKHFEILVDLDLAMDFRKKSAPNGFLEMDKIFTDSKKGLVAPTMELKKAFGTDDVEEISRKIVKSGEVLLTQDYREEEKEKRVKQVIDFLAKNTIDPKTKMPHTPERIKKALDESKVNIKNVPIESQIQEIIDEISKVLPVKVETKKVKIKIPSVHTGKTYGIVAQYKESEDWLPNGDLEVVASVPAGLVIDFYDKLNSITHGSAVTEDIREQ